MRHKSADTLEEMERETKNLTLEKCQLTSANFCQDFTPNCFLTTDSTTVIGVLSINQLSY